MEPPIEKLAAAALTGARKGFVLVVDDEELNRSLLRDPLEARGYEVAEADNGQQALEKMAQRVPDVILLDVMMPRMDGFELCRLLKSDEKTAHIPILMVTALSERKERLMGISAGANDFLHKPIDIQDVLLRVANSVYTTQLHQQLHAEREKSERLLRSMLPQAIAERLKAGEVNIADRHDEATVLVADLVGFTSLSAHIDPRQVVHLLNETFSAFDLLAEKYGVEKIKTMGDAYMAVGGIPGPKPNHVEAVVELARAMREEIAWINQQYNLSIRIRIGISTGPIIAGVIGRKRFAYDLWGETVNLACRLETSGEAGRIQIDETTYQRLKHTFRVEGKTDMTVKGCGSVAAYWLGDRADPLDEHSSSTRFAPAAEAK